MTDPIITDEEVEAYERVWRDALYEFGPAHPAKSLTRIALSAFLKARVPERQPTDMAGQGQYNAVWNACIDRVLTGK